MTGRALVIRKVGDPQIADAIANGIMPKQPTSFELETVKAELEVMKRREAELGVRVVRDRDYYYTKVKEAEYNYGTNPEYGRAARIALGLIGMVCEAVDGWYKYLSAWNRS